MYDPKPTVGRIVHYRLIAGGDVPVPAVVVTVDDLDPEILGLHVMHPRFTEKGEITAGCCHHAEKVKKGGGAGQWGWPPRA